MWCARLLNNVNRPKPYITKGPTAAIGFAYPSRDPPIQRAKEEKGHAEMKGSIHQNGIPIHWYAEPKPKESNSRWVSTGLHSVWKRAI